MPLFAPVMRMRLPACHGISAALHLVLVAGLLIASLDARSRSGTQLILRDIIATPLSFRLGPWASCHTYPTECPCFCSPSSSSPAPSQPVFWAPLPALGAELSSFPCSRWSFMSTCA